MQPEEGTGWLLELLSEVQLQQYFLRLRDDLNVTRLSHFEYVKNEDLEKIGMGRPGRWDLGLTVCPFGPLTSSAPGWPGPRENPALSSTGAGGPLSGSESREGGGGQLWMLPGSVLGTCAALKVNRSLGDLGSYDLAPQPRLHPI